MCDSVSTIAHVSVTVALVLTLLCLCIIVRAAWTLPADLRRTQGSRLRWLEVPGKWSRRAVAAEDWPRVASSHRLYMWAWAAGIGGFILAPAFAIGVEQVCK